MPRSTFDRSAIEQIVLDAIRATNFARQADAHLEESGSALLYSPGSHLDSLGLVSLLIEVEEGFRDAGVEVMLSDERAVSQKHSPFRDVPSLVEYIERLIAERPTLAVARFAFAVGAGRR